VTLLDAGPAATKADYRRDRWGRPLIVPATGGKAKPYIRASSAAKPIEDTYNIQRWDGRNTAYGMSIDPSLVARVLAIGGSPHEWTQEQKNLVNLIVDDARAAAQAQRQADIGTAVHLMVERLNRGEPVDGGPYQADLDAYRAAVDAMGWVIDPRYVECRMVCDELEMAGTCDLIVGAGGRTGWRFIADLKTGGTVEYATLGHAAQLAAYANGHLYDVDNDTHETVEGLQPFVGYIIHLPAGQGRCDIYELDLIAGLEAAHLANRVRNIRKSAKRWSTLIAAPSPPHGEVTTGLPPVEQHAEGGSTAPPVPTLGEVRTMWATPDEGPDVDARLYEAAANSYKALTAEQRSFVNAVAGEAQRQGVSFHMKERPTLRRFEIMRGLLLLAAADAGTDDVRYCVATVMDSDVPMWPTVAAGWALGALGVDEAKRFALLADDHAAGRTTVVGDRLVVAEAN
jgi:hypothetical protein